MTEYTGPWRYEVWHGLHHTVIDANGETVAFQISTADNARLIAAAPETAAERDRLLEELEVARTALRWIKEDNMLTLPL